MNRRTLVVGGAALGALLVAAIILLVVILNTVNGQSQEADYRACVERAGVYDTGNPDTIAGIAEECYSSVYG